MLSLIQVLDASRPVGDDLLGDLRGAGLVVRDGLLGPAGLDHHDGDVAVGQLTAGHDELEGALVALLVGRVGHPAAVLAVGHADGADRAVERDAAQHQRSRGGVDRQHVVRVLLVGADDGDDDLGLVAEAVGERRAQRPVDEPAGQDGLLAGTALPAEEGAGDLAGRVGPLLDVDGQGEEVDAVTDAVGGVGGGQHGGAADAWRRRRPATAGRACRSRRRGSRRCPRSGPDTVDGIRHVRMLLSAPAPAGARSGWAVPSRQPPGGRRPRRGLAAGGTATDNRPLPLGVGLCDGRPRGPPVVKVVLPAQAELGDEGPVALDVDVLAA